MDLSSYLAPEFSPFIQITLALFLGMILGVERILAGRTAGPRTYGLVSTGACLITIIAVASLTKLDIEGIRDPYPLLASIFTGVGFIGAGMIIFKDSKLSGLTTAAGIWVAAAIGMAVGFQYYLLSFFVTFLTLLVFTLMWNIERYIKVKFANELFQAKQKQDNE